MADALEHRLSSLDGNVLMLTGVRQGESAIRDQRIVMSCGKDGAECGQGWYQQVLPNAKGIRGRLATLAPLLHWRVCNIWDWLRVYAPMREYGGWATTLLADVYGGDEAEERNARTGCTGCPLTEKDLALDNLIAMPNWAYLAPLKGLKPLYRELRLPLNRIRKTGLEFRKDGTPAANPQRMGPLTFEARLMGLERVLAIQAEVNQNARTFGRPELDLLNTEEEARIRDLIAAGTWPDGWVGDEPRADTPMDSVFKDGSVQPLLV
jgi:DNA sulfur modification protein DndC